MERKSVDTNEIEIDESGRVILSDADLEAACMTDAVLAGAGITNGLNCSNTAGCQNSSNTAQCTNSNGACDGASNFNRCSTPREIGG